MSAGIFNVAHAVFILSVQCAVGVVCVHHRRGKWIHDGAVQSALQCHCKECSVDAVSRRQSKGNVGHTEACAVAQRFQLFNGGECRHRAFRTGRDRHGEGIYDDFFFRNAIRSGSFRNLFCDSDAVLGSLRNPVFSDRQCDKSAAIFLNERQDRFLTLLRAIDGVDEGFSVIMPQRPLHCFRIGGVDLQNRIGDRLQFFDDGFHHLRLIDLRESHIDIEHWDIFFDLAQTFL